MQEIRKNAVGTRLRWQALDNGEVFDVSAATTKHVKFTRPDSTQLTKTLAFVNSGTDGLLEYVVESNVLTLAGTYKWQILLAIGSWQDHSAKGSFVVGELLF